MFEIFIKLQKCFVLICFAVIIYGLGGLAVTIFNWPDDFSAPDTPKAVDYKLFDVNDCSYPGRVRKTWIAIAPTAISTEERAQTAIRAALELNETSGADVVQVYIQKDYDNSLLIANAWFAKDNGGMNGEQGWTWQITVTDPTTGDVVPYEVVLKE